MKKLISILATTVVIVLTWGISVLPTSVVEAQLPKKSATKRPAGNRRGAAIMLKRCRIKLIDEVTLASDRPGILAFVEPDEGDTVRAGQQVASLKDEIAKAALAVAAQKATNDIQIRFAVKAGEVAHIEYEKAILTNLKVKHAIPDIEVLRLKLADEKSVLQIEQAQKELMIAGLDRDEAQAQLATYSVEAPFDGVVTRVFKAKGEAVRQGDPILEIVSTRRVRVEGYVDIEDIWTVKAGAAVQVKLDIPGINLPVEQEVFEGRIVFVDEGVQPVTRQTRVWAEVANRNNTLRTGLIANMTIQPAKQVASKTAR